MGFCSGLSAGYLDLSPTSGNAWSPFFFFLIWGPAVRKKISCHGNLIYHFLINKASLEHFSPC